MIEVKNLVRNYGVQPAVRDVSFSVREGEILGFLGPNAAGKSTTMKMITGFLPLHSGSVTVDGLDIQTQSVQVRQRLGYLPENVPLYPDMTVSEYLRFHAKIKSVPSKEIKFRLQETLKKCFIEDVKDKLIGKLSKGYRQRVGLAQALIHDPKVLILDEPTVGLDPMAIKETRDLIKSLAGKHTVILSTHILPEVSMTCQRVVIIHKGKVVAEGTPESLANQLKGNNAVFLEVREDKPALEKEFQKLRGVIRLTKSIPNTYLIETESEIDLRDELVRLVMQQNCGLLELRPEKVSLEDVFVQLTTREEDAQ